MLNLYKTRHRFLLCAMAMLFAIQSHGQEYIEIIENAKGKRFEEVVQLVEAYYANRFKGKGSGYKQFKRWVDFHRGRLDANGYVVNVAQQTLVAAMAERRQRSMARIISDSPGNWQSLGPQSTAWPNHVGRINCVAVDPANPAIIYAGAPSGGLWRSVDDGESWQCLTDQLTSAIGVTSIAIDPSSDPGNRTLYMLTGDRPLGTVNSLGIWKSVDNGITWQKTNAPVSHPVYKMMMHPVDHNVLYYSNGSGMQKSTDGGNTWSQKISGRFTDFEFHPSNPSIMHAVAQNGTFRSSNGGETWQRISTGPANAYRAEIAVTAADPAFVYLFAGGDFDYSGLYKSTDHGLTFQRVPSAYRMSRQYWYNMALAVSPNDPNTLYAGEVYSYKSTDGGQTWTGAQLHHVDHHAMEFFNGYLYVANDGGVVRQSLATGQIDDLSGGLAITQMYRIGHHPGNSDELVFGSQDNGTSFLANNDAARFGGGDGMECFYNHSIPTFVYNSSQNGSLYRLDRTYSYTNNTGINPPGTRGNGEWITPFVADPNNGNTIYAGFLDVWRSTDRGDNWTNLTKGTTGSQIATALAVAPSDNNFIYIVKGSAYVYRSTDGGQSWTQMQTSGTFPFFTSLTIHPEDPDILVATGGDFGSGAGTRRIGISTDGGRTWTNISGSLPTVGVNCTVYQRNSVNGLYVGTDLGVYYRDDTMSDWISFDRGMPYVIVRDLEIDEAEGKIFAGTYGRGAFVSDLYGASDATHPVVSITNPEDEDVFTAPASIDFTASASDRDGSIVRVEFFSGPDKLGEDTTSPYAYSWNNVPAGSYWLIAKATDDDGLTSADSVNIVVRDGTACSGSGTILREVWTGVSGARVSSVPVDTPPSSTSELSTFEIPANIGDNYATRVRGFICVPETGGYTFWISSNDHSELWLSTTADPADKMKIASVTGYTNARQWDKFPTQKSAVINLVAGQRYYIEALHKEGVGTDHMAVGWQLPDGTMERPIQGDQLIPFGEPEPTACHAEGTILRELWMNVSGTNVSYIPVNNAPSSRDELTLFEIPSNIGDNYGTRVRGYLCVPEDGEYTFWISSNDHSELWLSVDDDPANKNRIAFVTGATNSRQWNKFSSQQSVPIPLRMDTRYYIEALQKEGVGTDHMAVGWQLPDGTFERPIPGDRLSPYIDAFATAPSNNGLPYSAEESADIQLFPNPYKEGVLTMMIAPAILMEGNARVSIRMQTSTGEDVLSFSVDCGPGRDAINIPLPESLSSGMYIIRATLNQRKYWKKLIVD